MADNEAPGTVSVVINVTATGRPEDAENLARAVLAATRLMVPKLAVGEDAPALPAPTPLTNEG